MEYVISIWRKWHRYFSPEIFCICMIFFLSIMLVYIERETLLLHMIELSHICHIIQDLFDSPETKNRSHSCRMSKTNSSLRNCNIIDIDSHKIYVKERRMIVLACDLNNPQHVCIMQTTIFGDRFCDCFSVT